MGFGMEVGDTIVMELIDEPVENKALDTSFFHFHRTNEWRQARQLLISTKYELEKATQDFSLTISCGCAGALEDAANNAASKVKLKAPEEEEAVFESAFACFNNEALEEHRKHIALLKATNLHNRSCQQNPMSKQLQLYSAK